MLREFERNRKLYRQRGIAEAFFAGLENRYCSQTRCKLPAKTTSMPLMIVAYNLRTFARVRTVEKMG